MECLSISSIDTRIEAAHIIDSISVGSDDAIADLFRVDALQALLDALGLETNRFISILGWAQGTDSTNHVESIED